MAEKKRPLDRRMLVFYAVLAVFCAASSFAHPVTPTLIVERNLDSSMFGIALAAMMTVNFLFAPFWGKMCGYVPTKRLMLIGCIGYSIGQAIFGAATSEAMVVGGRAFAGIFTSAVFTACSNYVVNTSSPEDRGSNLTVYATVQNVSFAVGFFIGGMLGLISVEAAFIAQVVLLAVSGFFLYLSCVDDTPLKHRPDHKLTLAEANPFAAFLDIRKFITPSLAMLFVIIAVCAIGQNSYEQVFNYYIKDQLGMSSAYNGTFKAIIAVTTIMLNVTLNMWLIRKTDIMKSYPIVLIAQLIPMIGMIFIKNKLAFSAAYIIFSTANAVRNPLQQNVAAVQTSPENSNSLIGFYHSLSSFGSVFGALFAGLIYEYDPFLPFKLAAALFACGIGLSFVFSAIHSGKRGKA